MAKNSKSMNGRGCARMMLDNGLEIWHVASPRFASVSVRIGVRTGSVDEGVFGGCGISHFAEHMAFIGAGKRGNESVSVDASAMGAELNACTWNDRTVYSADCPSHKLGDVLELLSQMLFEPNFTDEAFAKERDVILREIDMCSDDADEIVYDNLFAKMYLRNPIRYPIIGIKQRFESVKPDDLRAYFKNRYCAANMFVCISSSLPDSQVFAAVKKYFGERDGRILPSACEVELPQISSREIVEFGDCDIAKCLLAFKINPRNSREQAVWECLSFLLGAGNSSILSRALKYERPLADSVDSEIFRSGADTALIISWECPAKNCQKAKESALAELKKIADGGISERQVNRFCKSRTAAYCDAMRNAQAAAETLSATAFYGSDFEIFELQSEAVANMQDSEFTDIIASGWDFGATTYSVLLPKASKPRRKSTENKTSLSAPCVDTLSNGMRVVTVVSEEFVRAHIRLFSFGGLQFLPACLRGAFGLAAICSLRDTSKKSFREISEFAEDNSISFFSEFSDASASICAEALPEDIDKALSLVSGGAFDFKINPQTFATERRCLISDILDDMDDPLNAATLELRKSFFATHPLSASVDGDIESLKKTTPRDAAKILRAMYGTDSAIIGVGKFDRRDFLDACEKYFGSVSRQSARAKLPELTYSSGYERKKFKAKKEQSALFYAFCDKGLDDFKNDPIRRIMSEYLGGENGDIFDNVRQKEGLAYTASLARIAGINAASIYFYALSSSKNMRRISEIFSTIAGNLASGKIDSAKFELARAGAIARVRDAMGDYSEIAGQAGISLFTRSKVCLADTLCENIEAVKLTEAVKFAKRVFGKSFVLEVGR